MSGKARRLTALICGVLVLSTLGQGRVSAESVDFDDGYIGPDHPEAGYLGVEFRQQDADGQIFSWLGRQNNDFAACRDVNGDCETLDGNIEFTSLLPPCRAENQNNCIAELRSFSPDGSESAGQFNSFFPDRGWNDFVGDVSRGVPSGGPASLWTFPGLSHVGGDLFFVRVGVSGKKVKNSYVVQTFQAGITAVSPLEQQFCEEDETGLSQNLQACSPRMTYLDEPRDGRMRGGFGLGGGSGTSSTSGSDCVMRGNYQGNGICMTRRAFPGEMKFRLVVRLSQGPKGWLHGRLAEPDVTLTSLPKPMSGIQISVTGKSITVPVVQAGMQYSELPAALQKDYENANKWTGFRGLFGCCAGSRNYAEGWDTDMAKANYHSYPTAWSDHGIDELAAWLPHIGDKATADLSTWSIRTLSADEMNDANKCLTDDTRIVGIVTTNSTQYSGGPPKYNRETATLDYRVAAPHYRSGGTKFFGIYNLIMRSDLARCLYGFSKAPLNASVSVVDDKGVTTVGTRNISEKDGWIKIAAYGFGFSVPTIKVKLTQGSKTVKQKMITISCKKGKTIKKVSGKNPKCSAGYKKMKT